MRRQREVTVVVGRGGQGERALGLVDRIFGGALVDAFARREGRDDRDGEEAEGGLVHGDLVGVGAVSAVQ